MENPYAYGGLLCGDWSPPPMMTLPLQEGEARLLERRERPEPGKSASAVTDAASLEDIVVQFNRLLSSLRAAGLLQEEQTGCMEGEIS